MALNIKYRMWPGVKWPQAAVYKKDDATNNERPKKIESFGIFCCWKGAGSWNSRIEIFYWVIKTNRRFYHGSRYQSPPKNMLLGHQNLLKYQKIVLTVSLWTIKETRKQATRLIGIILPIKFMILFFLSSWFKYCLQLNCQIKVN